jgi:glycosyltransferase involved in cell wall biosynthesis
LADQQDYLLVYAPPWSGPTRFSKHHLACHLASQGGRVLYVEAPLTPVGLRRGRGFLNELAKTFQAPRRVDTCLWVRRHFAPVPYHAATSLTSRRLANQLAQRLLAPMIRRDLAGLGIHNPILIAGLPHAVDLLPLVRHTCVVYHCADDYASVRGFPASLPALEADLCRQADLVITTSETLWRDRLRFNANTHWVPNGVDFAHFGGVAEPARELQHLKKPVVGFVGGLSEWVDIDLIAELAKRRREWAFVLIGPIGVDVSRVQTEANVHLLGPKPYTELPSYLAAMDVALIPFKRDRVTYHADPIKAYEYLAAGLPVVATEMPALRRLDYVVRLAQTAHDFENQIEAAIQEGRDTRKHDRQSEAARHSWSSRFETIDALVRQSPACAS